VLHTVSVGKTSLTVLTSPAPPRYGECCPSLVSEPLSSSQAADLAHVMKALADPTRLRLVSMVAAHENGEACVCELTDPLGLTQPTISHHLKILVDAGILTRSQRGKWAYYAIVATALDSLAAILTTSK
jgi:ArsR family transcriptional regulator